MSGKDKTPAVDVDDDIDNYTIDNLLQIYGLVEPTVFQIKDAANSIIARMKAASKDSMVLFLEKARDKLLAYFDPMQKDVKNEPLEDEETMPVEDIWDTTGFNEKGEKKVRYFTDKTHFVPEHLKQEPAAIVPPIIARHIINIDSQYRSSILPYSTSPLSTAFNTNFSFNLSSPIKKTVAMILNSIQLPTSWYSFGKNMGNSFFIYDGIQIIVPDGNYTIDMLISTINTVAASNIATNKLTVSYNTVTSRVSFYNNETLTDKVTITFFDQSNVVSYTNCGLYQTNAYQFIGINTTLGWALGFRTVPDTVTGNVNIDLYSEQSIVAEAIPDAYGPRYFTLSIEDYSNQRLTSGLLSINNASGGGNNASLRYTDYFKTIHVNCKLREGTLTQNQQNVINAIKEDNNPTVVNMVRNTLNSPTSGSAFAIIPLRDIKNVRPDPYIIFGADLQAFRRVYLEPSYIDRLTVQLHDDKGNLVNLNDVNWSFSLIFEERLN
jgi:hypothetical protein